ncbi:hypothetical protein PRN20_18230 [Devosia sp. ZB163]|uniref:hypothetical protein n=1 Tax=Devosia sp. ZB163 TaxID=3025938 RepID=UPI00235F6C24|nr:hypothetical protein [Devosia sp. ZB163]MDC9825676.1 hypothetical protein [Devosia sp. ZB163]
MSASDRIRPIPIPSARLVEANGMMAKVWYDWFVQLAGKLDELTPLQGTATYDPASLADGAGATTTVTVPGAALGDMAAASFSLATSGILITAWVSAANTVSVRFQNESGGALDIGSGMLTARVLK